jgi:hypothetical protein
MSGARCRLGAVQRKAPRLSWSEIPPGPAHGRRVNRRRAERASGNVLPASWRVQQGPIAMGGNMKFLVMIYNDDSLLEALPEGEFNTMMHGCFVHADELRAEGHLLDSMQLESPAQGKSLRMRDNRMSVMDGPFAEAKEYLGGFNLIEAADMDEAVRIAAEFPWARTGRIEVRPVRDIDAVRRSVGA